MSIFNPELREYRESNFEANKFTPDTEKKLLQALDQNKEQFPDIVQCPNKSCGVPIKIQRVDDFIRAVCPSCGWQHVLRNDVKKHEMKLNEGPFTRMLSGEKKFELRLNDEKRQRLRAGDRIIFRKLPELEEELTAEIISLNHFPSFAKMYESLKDQFPKKTKQSFVESMYKYYSVEDEKKYGALAIEVNVIQAI